MEQALHDTAPDGILDLESHSRLGTSAPQCRGYRIRVNHEQLVFYRPVVTGAAVLELAQLCPQAYCLVLRVRGSRPRVIELDTQVDLSAPGVERFVALKLGPVTVKVNEHPVVVEGPKTTGLTIKEAAAKAGLIELDFVLSIEVSGGKTKIVGDQDMLILEGDECFIAVAPDDNS